MRIGLLAPPFLPVPPGGYGGTERIVAVLADALVERGHDVTLFASEGSRTRAKLAPVVDEPVWLRRERLDDDAWRALAISRTFAQVDGLDVLHNHVEYHAFPAASRAPLPMVTTVHSRLDTPEARAVYSEFKELPLVSISDAQRAPVPSANWVATVPHGLSLDQYRPSLAPGRWLAACGRFSPEKGLDQAIDVAIAAGLPIKIAAAEPPRELDAPWAREARAYFEAQIRPRLGHPLVEWLGELDDEGKQELYGGALALLFPIDWPEPFGLVMIEALACGTPVLARPRGSVPEVVRDGVTGRLCETRDDFLRALDELPRVDRATCRRDFEARFSAQAMAARYEEAYAQVREARERARKARLPSITPVDRGRRAPLRADERQRFERALAEILERLGLPRGAPDTRATPARLLQALWEATSGYDGDEKLLTAFPRELDEGARSSTGAQQVVEGPIRFYALCEHHAVPFFGAAFVAYVPGDCVIEASKLSRLVHLHARRFTFAERVVEEVAGKLDALVAPLGVAVRLEAVHLCTQMRGVRETSARTLATSWRGRYATDAELRREFLQLCDGR